MYSEPRYLKRARFYSSVIMLYMVTLLFAWYIVNPYGFFRQPHPPITYSLDLNQLSAKEIMQQPKTVTGKPVRLVVAAASVDLPVDEGYYNEVDQTWTLSAKHAQFAMPSMYANNARGNTLIYGHYNVYVFYNLKKVHTGDLATVYTDNGHQFTYAFKSSEELHPDDVTVFDYNSYPMLTIQTCSGSFYEYRQMFHFDLQKVDGQNV